MSTLKTAGTEGIDIKRFEIVKSLLPLHVDILKVTARPAPIIESPPVNTQMPRLNSFQIDLSNVASLIKENKIEEAHALYKEACDAFFSKHGEFIYDKNKDAFEYVNNHFEEFAKWLLSNEKVK